MLKAATLAIALAAASSGIANAQIAADHPRNCVLNVGPTQMMFSAFQENKADEIFCQHVAEVGPTMIILDSRDPELRSMNIDVRLIRNVGQKDWRDDLDANTAAVIPAGKYFLDKNTWSFRTNIDKDGEYITVVRATSDDGVREYVGQYYFSVGSTGEWYAISGLLVTFVAGMGFEIWRRSRARPSAGSNGSDKAPAPAAVRQST